MESTTGTYKLSKNAILVTLVLALLISIVFKWSYTSDPINFVGGDAADYYSTLVSLFISHDLQNQTASEWYLLKTNSGTINVHPIGVSLLLLPFFLLALLAAEILNYPLTGFSLPFQIAVATAALTYAALGLVYVRKLFKAQGISDTSTALIIILIFMGTNLIHYTLSEAGMSHVYSFALVSAFLFYSSKFVTERQNRHLLISALVLGLILLVRPNNIFVMLTVFLWFRNAGECRDFFRNLFRNSTFYIALLGTMTLVSLQSAVWYIQTGSFFQDTYRRDGFYWLHPHLRQMLFGFDAGFFIYTPLCFLLLFGMIALYRENRFSFYAGLATLVTLFYFFASYNAYTYFDGLGIRVLVDYYAVFAFMGARLFELVAGKGLLYAAITGMAMLFLGLNLVYCYQANRGILLRAGMNFQKWKYVFLKTGPAYQNCLGGSNELKPYAATTPSAAMRADLSLQHPYNFSNAEYGPALSFDGLGFDSNRLSFDIACARSEAYNNASRDALICVTVHDPSSKANKAYGQFKLNETPATTCCESRTYSYTKNLVGDFRKGDILNVYLWNIEKQPFFLEKLAASVYDYKYQLN